jgi:hypothetical protein
MLNADFYDLTQNTQGAIFQGAYAVKNRSLSDQQQAEQPAPHPLLQLRQGRAESPGWMLVQIAEFDPEPLTVAKFRTRAVYASEHITRAILELMASEKWLDRIGDEYYATETGREIMAQRAERRDGLLENFQPIPAADIERIEALMRQIVDAGLEKGDPPGTWCLAHSRNRAPADDAPPLVKIFQYCADFNALRDDAHMAAYRPHGVAGHTWEAFSLVGDGLARTADDLFDQLAYRGYSRQEWADSLGELVRRGWVETANGKHSMIEEGQTIRDKAEGLTDAYFFASWSSLNQQEIEELHHLLVRLHDESLALTG